MIFVVSSVFVYAPPKKCLVVHLPPLPLPLVVVVVATISLPLALLLDTIVLLMLDVSGTTGFQELPHRLVTEVNMMNQMHAQLSCLKVTGIPA